MNILIVRVSAIGDVIHTLPALHLIKHVLPTANIDWVVQKKASSLLVAEPRLRHVWELPDHFLVPRNILKTLSVINKLREYNWDAIVDFQGIHKTSLLIGCLSGRVFGFSRAYARAASTAWFSDEWATPESSGHIVQKNLALARLTCERLTGGFWQEPKLNDLQKSFTIAVSEQEQQSVDVWINGRITKPFVILAPNTTWPSKHWPLAYWQELVKMLACSEKFDVLLAGRQFIGQQAEQIAVYAAQHQVLVHIIPPWPLHVMAHVIKRASLVVAPDTGLLHLADFLGSSTIGLFGPTHGIKHGPMLVHPDHRYLCQVDCPHHYKKVHGHGKGLQNEDCMYKLAPGIVYDQVVRLIHQKRLA